MKVKLQPPSGSELPAHNPILPPSAITQVMLIANPAKVGPITAASLVFHELLGPVVRSPIKLILGKRKIFSGHLFTAKAGFAVKLWPSEVINDKFLFLEP